jgi:Flp pilus assembly protein TadB
LTGSIVAGLAPAGAVIVELLDPSVVPRLVSTPLSATLLGTAAVFEVLALAALHRLARVR